MSEPYIAIQVVMMPSDTNPHGTIFGGVILSHIDLAGAIAARREILKRGGASETIFVTVAINRVEFTKPVFVGRCRTVSNHGRTHWSNVDHDADSRRRPTGPRRCDCDRCRGCVCWHSSERPEPNARAVTP